MISLLLTHKLKNVLDTQPKNLKRFWRELFQHARTREMLLPISSVVAERRL